MHPKLSNKDNKNYFIKAKYYGRDFLSGGTNLVMIKNQKTNYAFM